MEEMLDLKLQNMDAKLASMNEKLEIHRRELLAEIGRPPAKASARQISPCQ